MINDFQGAVFTPYNAWDFTPAPSRDYRVLYIFVQFFTTTVITWVASPVAST